MLVLFMVENVPINHLYTVKKVVLICIASRKMSDNKYKLASLLKPSHWRLASPNPHPTPIKTHHLLKQSCFLVKSLI